MAYSHQNIFIQGLSPNEQSIVESHLKRGTNTSEKGKSEILYEALISEPTKYFTDRELEEITGSYGNAFRTLKSRLFDKATEALIHDKYCQDANFFNEKDRAVFRVRKNYLILRILNKTNRREGTKIVSELLSQVIKTSKEYEIFDVLIEALYFKKRAILFESNFSANNSILNEIEFYQTCLRALNSAHHRFHKVAAYINFPSNHTYNEYTKLIKKSIEETKQEYNVTKSAYVKFYLSIFEFALAEQQKNYTKALEICKNLLKFVKNNKAVYLIQRLGLVHSNLALYYIFLGNFKSARQHIITAQDFYAKNSHNQFICIELRFYIEYYDKNYVAALEAYNMLSDHNLTDAGRFKKSKYEFFHAWLLFAQKKFKEALQVLIKPFEIEKEKTLWNIGLKILIVQTYIELGKFDEASRGIEALRKHILRHGKGGKIKKRDILIFKTLKAYEKEGFNYPLGNKTIPKLLKELSIKNKPISWEYRTPEMIPFHEWMENR